MTSVFNRLKALWNPVAAASSRRRRTLRSGCYKPRLENLEGRLALATLELSGTLSMDSISGTVGADLASTVGHDNGWTMLLDDVSYSLAEEQNNRGCDYDATAITRVHAVSFQFQFTGPDAALLDEAVGQHFVGGGLTGGAIFEAANVTCTYSRIGDDNHGEYTLHLVSTDPAIGVSLVVQSLYTATFPVDASGYPDATVLVDQYATITLGDHRSGNDGQLASYPDWLQIGNYAPPPPPPTLQFAADVSQVEGNKGWALFVFTVTLSSPSSERVTVNFDTADGSATAATDYESKRGVLDFSPGETSKTITIRVKGDRKLESNESFYIRLSSATNAAIQDELGMGVILNDDGVSIGSGTIPRKHR